MSNAMYTRDQVAEIVKGTMEHLDAIGEVLYTLDSECADLTTGLVVDFARDGQNCESASLSVAGEPPQRELCPHCGGEQRADSWHDEGACAP